MNNTISENERACDEICEISEVTSATSIKISKVVERRNRSIDDHNIQIKNLIIDRDRKILDIENKFIQDESQRKMDSETDTMVFGVLLALVCAVTLAVLLL